MGEHIAKITKETLLPIGMTISIISAIAFGSWQLSSINTRLQFAEQRVNNTPTTAQFSDLQSIVNEMNRDIKTLIGKK